MTIGADKKYKYKFTIIMSVYNVDRWIREAIDSVIAQDIGFEDNVQIILVNDGSPDDSEAICLEYRDRYPDNIIYIKKKNGGLSSARNEGLKHRQGEYINFFDPDDILSENTLSSVYRFFQNNSHIKMATIPLVYFEAKTGLHAKYRLMGKKTRIINLDNEPHNFVLSSAGSFYQTDSFEGLEYRSDLHTGEDTELNIRYLFKHREFGYVVGGGVTYHYRKRSDGGSMVDSVKEGNLESFLPPIKIAEVVDQLVEGGDRPSFIDQCLIYEIRSRIQILNPDIIDNKLEYSKLIDAYRRVISTISDREIRKSPFLSSRAHQYIFLSNIKQHKPKGVDSSGWLFLQNGIEKVTTIRPFVKFFKETSDGLTIDCLLHTYGLPIDLVLVGSGGKTINARMIRRSVESSHDVLCGGHNLSKAGHYRFYIKGGNLGEYIFSIKFQGEIIPVDPYIYRRLPFALNARAIVSNYGKIDVSFSGNRIKFMSPGGSFRYFKSKLLTTITILKRGQSIPLMRWLAIFSGKTKYIVLTDRPFKAGDNSEALFKYINSHEKELAKNTVYAISKYSPDYSRLKKLGRVVPFGGFRHKYFFVRSKLIVSSHTFPGFISPYKYGKLIKLLDTMRYKFVWLQHGVTQNDIFGPANKFNHGISAIVSGSNHENKIFSQDRYFYDKEDIIDSGFPRLDYNINNPKPVITVMPTWRSYLSGSIKPDGTHELRDGFEESEFYIRFKSLLRDVRLINKLRESGNVLNFMLHPGLMGQAHLFKKYENDVVKVIDSEKVDYSRVLSESSLLVTDYSSVFFDFAYMYKPVVLYQFDRDEFRSSHYKPSRLFDYDKHAPGHVFIEHDPLVGSIMNYVDTGFELENKYKKRIDKMFIHHDRNNSKRLIEELRRQNYL